MWGPAAQEREEEEVIKEVRRLLKRPGGWGRRTPSDERRTKKS